MTQQEFTKRTKVEVSSIEFDAIHVVYMGSDLDKDDFCKMWVKMNQNRVKQAIAAKKAQAENEGLKWYISNLYWSLHDLSIKKPFKLASICLTQKQQNMLAKAGIEIEDDFGRLKQICDVRYEMWKFIKA